MCVQGYGFMSLDEEEEKNLNPVTNCLSLVQDIKSVQFNLQ